MNKEELNRVREEQHEQQQQEHQHQPLINNQEEKTEKFLGVRMTPKEKHKAKIGMYFVVAFMILVAIFQGNLFNNTPTNEELYDKAIFILKKEFERPNGYDLDYSSEEMASIEEISKDVYRVQGSLFDEYGDGADFTVKLSVNSKGEFLNYEWLVEPYN